MQLVWAGVGLAGSARIHTRTWPAHRPSGACASAKHSNGSNANSKRSHANSKQTRIFGKLVVKKCFNYIEPPSTTTTTKSPIRGRHSPNQPYVRPGLKLQLSPSRFNYKFQCCWSHSPIAAGKEPRFSGQRIGLLLHHEPKN